MAQPTVLQYESAWPVYALDWCKSGVPGGRHSAFRLAAGSLTEDFRNTIAVLGLRDERVLIEDDADPAAPAELATLAEAAHGYPATSVQWQPASAAGQGYAGKGHPAELLASTGDMLRVWSFSTDGGAGSGYVGRAPSGQSYSLTAKHTLSGSKTTNGICAPLTAFSWNATSPARIVTASVDTTCTVWDVDAAQAVTQLIAHDRAVHDVAWLPGDTNIFVSVGADGSLRAFDLRSLEHSTILYETPPPAPAAAAGAPPSTSAAGRATSPLLRICFHPSDQNYMATFHMDGHDVQVLDMRAPGQPVFELRAHRAQVNAVAFGSSDKPLLASAGDDAQLLLWDLAPHMAAQGQKQPSAPRHGSSPRPDKAKWRTVSEPAMAYTGVSEISSLAWSPQISGGEWLAFAMGRTIKALKV